MALIKKGTETIAAMALRDVDDWLEQEGLGKDAVTVEANDAEIRDAARAAIHRTAGDADTLIGTYGDGVTFLLVEIGRLAAALRASTTLAQAKTAATPLADALAPIVAGVGDGTIKLPYKLKTGGQAAALTEIGTRITRVAEAFEGDDG